MNIIDGICYAEEPESTIEIKSVKPLDDMIMLLTFNSGETRLFDATVLTGKVFEPLKNETVFKNVTLNHGVVTWKNGEIDCAPEFMYENSYEYPTME